MLDNYMQTQPIAYKFITNFVKKNRKSHAYIIESKDIALGINFALAISKFLLCPENKTNSQKCVNCTQCHRIDENCFSELKIVRSDGLQIKKNQIENLQKEFSLKSIESTTKIYIIEYAERLNDYSSAALLKFLEEPEANIIALLVTSNKNLLLETIVSRCQIISLLNNNMQHDDIVEEVAQTLPLTEKDKQKFILEECSRKKIENIYEFISLLDKKNLEALLYTNKYWHDFFKTKEDYTFAFNVMSILYKKIIDIKLGFSNYDQHQLIEISKNNDLEILCKRLSIIISYQEKIINNLNLPLMLDKFIMDMGE